MIENNICSNCTGCLSCYYSCPNKAISVGTNSEGFYVPKIDKDLCDGCGLCVRNCPQNNIAKLNTPAEAFVIKASDELRQQSSSGGMFGAIANYVFSQGGIVCGAAFNDDFKKIEHIILNRKDDLFKLQG